MAKWTAEHWDRCEDAREMLQELRGHKTSRKALRWFSVAMCNRFRRVVMDPRCLAALDAAERDAVHPLDRETRLAARARALEAVQLLPSGFMTAGDFWETETRYWQEGMLSAASKAFVYVLDAAPLSGAITVSNQIAEAAAWERVRDFDANDWEHARKAELLIHADLLRHIVGNPFRPSPAPPVLPARVVRLASALEAGEPVAFALHDALLEAGQTELAEHFGGDEPHPRGCWALDVIGGRS